MLPTLLEFGREALKKDRQLSQHPKSFVLFLLLQGHVCCAVYYILSIFQHVLCFLATTVNLYLLELVVKCT